MNKKELIIPILVIGLSLLFIGICIAVFLTNGTSKKWVARKMKIGGLLLSLTVVSCTKSVQEIENIPTCYIAVASNTIWVQTNNNYEIEIKPDTGNIVKGAIEMRNGENFSFSIMDKKENKCQGEEIVPYDGDFDESHEDFEIVIDKHLPAGEYFLNLFDVSLNNQNSTNPRNKINLIIKNE